MTDEARTACTVVLSNENFPHALLPGGSPLAPDSMLGGFHGTSLSTPAKVRSAGGFTAHGTNPSLLDHVEQRKLDSAFRGTTELLSTPGGAAGAVQWAGNGGYVYEIRGVPTWDVNKALEGRVHSAGTYGGNPVRGELENAIPGEVPWTRVKRVGRVATNRAGQLVVSSWETNPSFTGSRGSDSSSTA